jgi:hypothetical protein
MIQGLGTANRGVRAFDRGRRIAVDRRIDRLRLNAETYGVRVARPGRSAITRRIQVRPTPLLVVAVALTLGFAGLGGCGDGDETTSGSASVTGITGPTGPNGPTSVADLLHQYARTHPLPALPQVDQACENAKSAAEVYDRLRIGNAADYLLEHGGGNIKTHAFEILGFIGLVGTSSPQACSVWEGQLENLLP